MSGKLRLTLIALLLFCIPAGLQAAFAASGQEARVEALVRSAVELIKAKGEAALADLNTPNGPWQMGATCVFVSDEKGVELVNAADPALVGKSLWNFRDPDGKLVVQEQWALVRSDGGGWVECKWVKPGGTKAVPCRSFVQGVRVDGKEYLVGAAYYLD